MKDFIKAVLLVIGFLILLSVVCKGDDMYNFTTLSDGSIAYCSTDDISNTVSDESTTTTLEKSWIDFEENTFNMLYRIKYNIVYMTYPPQYPDDDFVLYIYGYANGKIKLIEKKKGYIKPKQIIPEKFMIGTQETTF